ncbi:MAG: ferredoxin oxidoreductase [Patescibacteria group bacterium]|nr:ferredoxin oxidoreductase [Patescibacteria group bacterium]
MSKEFLIGNEIIVRACLAAGAEIMFGYPITPTTEIMSYWTKISEKDENDQIKFLQAEDEMAAGFAMIGAILGGKKAFTATSGPGTVLMQDPMSMAEAMRLPTVTFIMQRGGPSTGTVIYSQQELILTSHGGNGEGMRIVYAPATLQELYDLSIKAFDTAWRYRFPAFILGDGYIAKMQGEVEIWSPEERRIELTPAIPYLGEGKDTSLIRKFQPTKSFAVKNNYVNLRNCFNLEEEILRINMDIKKAFDEITSKISECEAYNCEKAEKIIIAYGIVAAAVKQALKETKQKKFGLFRPITLNPFPKEEAREITQQTKKIYILESSLGQFASMVKENLYGLTTPIEAHGKPGVGFTPEEIKGILL